MKHQAQEASLLQYYVKVVHSWNIRRGISHELQAKVFEQLRVGNMGIAIYPLLTISNP